MDMTFQSFACWTFPEGKPRVWNGRDRMPFDSIRQPPGDGAAEMKHRHDGHTLFVRHTGRCRTSIFVCLLLLIVLLSSAACTSSADRPYEGRDRWDRRSTTDWQDY